METLELKIQAQRLKESGMLQGQEITSSKNSPIYLNVDTGWDFGAIVTAVIGFAVAVLVARFTVGVQRNQIKANISNFRHHWMVDLRECASELIQLMALMINNSAKQRSYKPSEDYLKHYSRALQLRSKVELLLSRDDEYTAAIRSACANLLEAINEIKIGDEINPRIAALVAFQDLLRGELERAWDDTKSDLGINSKAFGIPLFRK